VPFQLMSCSESARAAPVILSEAKDLKLCQWLRLRFLAAKAIKGSE